MHYLINKIYLIILINEVFNIEIIGDITICKQTEIT